MLERGGSSLYAVEAAIKILEDDPLFNAGRGSDFAADGKNEMDAAIMDGSNLKAGAAGDVTRTRHPISLARAVMEKSPHVFLVGEGADAFSVYAGLEQEEPSYFFTERRWQDLVRELKKEGLPIPPRPAGAPPPPAIPAAEIESPDAHKYGTVGVVALDRARQSGRRHFPPEAQTPSAGGASAIRRSSAQGPTLPTSLVRYPPPAPASTLSALRSLAPCAPSSSTRALVCRQLSTR